MRRTILIILVAATLAATGWAARARLATARYATNLQAAKADGYQLITRMIPDMGWHFLNPTIQGFDVTKPPILVYERHRGSWQLGALEWPSPPGRPLQRPQPLRPALQPRLATHRHQAGPYLSWTIAYTVVRRPTAGRCLRGS